MSKPNIKVKGKISDFNETVKKDQTKQSNFYLTINLNQGYNDDDEHLGDDTEIFDGLLSGMLNHINDYINLPNGVEWNDDNIKDVDVDYVIEKGNTQKRLHAHMLIKIKHNTNVKLNFPKIKKYICESLGLKNIYMNNMMSRANNDNILQYIDKYTKKK